MGFHILHQSSPPVIPRSRQGFLKMSKSWFLKAASATTRLLAGLCGWDSHILAVTPTRHLSALLCPALFINIFLSIQHKVHFATQRAWNSNDLCLNGKLHQTPCQTGCGWTFLNFLAPWHLCLGCAQPWHWNAESAGKELSYPQSRPSRCALPPRLESALCLILHWSSRFERLL